MKNSTIDELYIRIHIIERSQTEPTGYHHHHHHHHHFICSKAVQYANQVQQFNKNNEQDTPGSYKRLW